MVFNVPYLVVSYDCCYAHESPVSDPLPHSKQFLFYRLVLQRKLIVKPTLTLKKVHTLKGKTLVVSQ